MGVRYRRQLLIITFLVNACGSDDNVEKRDYTNAPETEPNSAIPFESDGLTFDMDDVRTRLLPANKGIIFQDNFDKGLDSGKWRSHADSGNQVVATTGGWLNSSGKQLQLNLARASGGKHVMAEASLGESKNFVARVFFYDDMARLANMFVIADATDTEQTGLGVMSSLANDRYSIRINSLAGTKATSIKRSKGWHMFEIIITANGSFAKIDNQLVYDGSSGPLRNPSHTTGAKIKFVSSWDQPGKAYFDELALIKMDTANWQDLLFAPLGDHYALYGGGTQPAFQGMMPSLGKGMHSNDLRSVMDAVIAWYLFGKKKAHSEPVQKARKAFNDAWTVWQKSGYPMDNWARGAAMFRVALAAHLLRNEPEVKNRIAEIHKAIGAQARVYLQRMPVSGYIGDTKAEENGWHAGFIAAAVNFFPQALGNSRWELEAKARCFAYHAITFPGDPAYCGVSTQTVHADGTLENHNKKNPIYVSGTLQVLAEGALAYLIAGNSVPGEFAHNVSRLYQTFINAVDINTMHYKVNPEDWSGAHSTGFIAPGVLHFAKMLGIDTKISWQDFVQKRSLFYQGMVSEWHRKPIGKSAFSSWNQSDANADSYKYFLDSVDAGEFYALAAHAQSIKPACPANGKIISLRARLNGLLVAAHNFGPAGDHFVLTAEGRGIGSEDMYRVITHADGTMSLQSLFNQKYVAAGDWNNWRLRAEGSTLGIEDKYYCGARSDGTITLKSALNNKYVAAGDWNGWFLRAEGSTVGAEDLFEVLIH